MNRATVNKIFQKHPVYVKAGMIAVISIIIFGCVYSKDNGKKLEKDEKGKNRYPLKRAAGKKLMKKWLM